MRAIYHLSDGTFDWKRGWSMVYLIGNEAAWPINHRQERMSLPSINLAVYSGVNLHICWPREYKRSILSSTTSSLPIKARIIALLFENLTLNCSINKYSKIPKISPGLIFFEGPFWGAYFWRGLSTEGNLHLQIDWASLIVGSKFTVFVLFYFVFEGNFPSTSPRGLIFGGAI